MKPKKPSSITSPEEKARPHHIAVENWLTTQVAAAYDALRANPSRAITVDELRAHLSAVKETPPRGPA
jgi:hypothetical protein